MEARTNLQQRANTPTGTDFASSWCGDLAQKFQQGALACAVLADNAHHIALFDLEINVLQSPYIIALAFGTTIICLANLQIRIFHPTYVDGPPTFHVMGQSAR